MKDKRQALVPRLRFSEFREVGEWDSYSLGDITRFSSGGTPSKDIAEYWGGSIPWISASSMYETNIGKSELNVTALAIGNGTRIAKKGSLLILVRGSMLFNRVPIGIATIDVAFNQDVKALEVNNDISEIFLLFQLISLESRIPINETGIGAGKIDTDHLKHLTVFIPSIKEQQKIADCLSSLDTLIAAQADKLDALKTHKKGLMQQLFPRDGETVPRLRFPEFLEAGEWEEKTIADLKPFVTSGSRGWAAFYAKNGSLFVRITNLTRESIYLDLTDSKFVQLPQEANEGVRTQLKEGDVLISITADIGIIGYVDVNILSPAYINQHIALVRFDLPDVCSKYVSYLLASDRAQNLFRASTDTGTKAGMSLIMVQKIKLVLPALPEQQKIADCLSSLDVLITAQADKLDALKIHKKGLMQQLFPGPEA